MEKLINSLETVKRHIPFTCTQANLQKLQVAFIKYKYLVSDLPGANPSLLENKINAITAPSISWKESKYCFRDAIASLHHEIDELIESLLVVG